MLPITLWPLKESLLAARFERHFQASCPRAFHRTRPAPRGQERLKEAAKLGFSVAIVPKANAPKKPGREFEGLTIHAADRVEQAMELVRSLE